MNSENQVPKARNISAQHGAEGGVLGQWEKQPESPGDGTVLTQTLQSCLIRSCPFYKMSFRLQEHDAAHAVGWGTAEIWRRGGDSNSRYRSRYGRFRGGSFQPLTHLSARDCHWPELPVPSSLANAGAKPLPSDLAEIAFSGGYHSPAHP
jgi:hypothetical protein